MSRDAAAVFRARRRPPTTRVHPGVDGESRLVNTADRRAYDAIRAAIRQGELAPGEALVESTLMQDLQASRGAVRRALQLLASEGLVLRRTRSGTRVAAGIISAPMVGEVIPCGANGGDRTGGAAQIVVHPLERRLVEPVAAIAERLGLDPCEPVVVLEQVLLVDGEPIGVRSVHFSGGGDPIGVRDRLAGSDHHPRPFPAVFELLYGERPGRSEVTVEAVPCDLTTSRVLGVETGTPVLLRETLHRDRRGTPKAISHAHFRGDRLALTAAFDHD